MTQNQTPVTTTEHKIGKVTYLVCSSASERATDTLDKKIKTHSQRHGTEPRKRPEIGRFFTFYT